jgi:hypothetical protein
VASDRLRLAQRCAVNMIGHQNSSVNGLAA